MNTFAARVEPKGCTGAATPGSKAFLAYLLDTFPYTKSMGLYNCRNVAGKSDKSEHAEGRALDLGIPITTSKKAKPELGDPVTELLMPHGKRLGIQLMIYNRRAWSARSPDGREYKGPHPHYDHVHLGLTPIAGAMLTYATLEEVLGGAEPAPELNGITHRVTATALNLRDLPGLSAPAVASLRRGTAVAAQPMPTQPSDGYEWVNVRAISGRSEVEGWVATGFLEPVAPSPLGQPITTSTREKPAPKGMLHRVNVETTLNLRASPALSGGVIAELPTGSTVELLVDVLAMSDGFHWVLVRAIDGARALEGWVARECIEPIAIAETVDAPSADEAANGLGQATHQVDATSLYIRSGPALDADLVGELPQGAFVRQVADVRKESDGYTWVNVHALDGTQILEGWVASDCLEALG